MHLTHDDKQENNQDNNISLQWAKITTCKGHQISLNKNKQIDISIYIYIQKGIQHLHTNKEQEPSTI